MNTGVATRGKTFCVSTALTFVVAVIVPCGSFFVCKAIFLCHCYLPLPPLDDPFDRPPPDGFPV